MHFWSEIILVISKSNAAAQSFDSDVTRMISEQSLLHPVQLPCSTGIQHFFSVFPSIKGYLIIIKNDSESFK